MPYTTQQIATQQAIVDDLKENINWVKDVSYNFEGKGDPARKWNGTRTAFWSDWRTNNPNATWSGLTWDADTSSYTGTLNEPFTDSGVEMVPSQMYDWWQWEQVGSEGYENGDWTSWISTKEGELATAESTLATMQADPA